MQKLESALAVGPARLQMSSLYHCSPWDAVILHPSALVYNPAKRIEKRIFFMSRAEAILKLLNRWEQLCILHAKMTLKSLLIIQSLTP